MVKPVKTEAICMKVRNWRESSRIVGLFCLDLGRVYAVARGARRPKSGFGAALDLFAHSQVLLYLRENRELATVGSADLITANAGIGQDYNRLLAAGKICGFLHQIPLHHHPEPKIFHLLKNSLAALSNANASQGFSGLIGSFILKTSAFLGFRPVLDRCVICHKNIEPGADKEGINFGFDMVRGGVVCPDCTRWEKGLITAEEILILQRLLLTPVIQLILEEISPRLLQLVNDYADFHFGMRSA